MALSFNTDFFKNNKREILFGAVGVALVLVLLSVFVSSVRFIANEAESALVIPSSQSQLIRFNLEALPQLGVGTETPQEPQEENTIPAAP
jgi:hypothetical protein